MNKSLLEFEKMNISKKEDIFNPLQQHKANLRKFNVKKIGLFGSFLKGKSTNESDIDLLVEFDEGKKNYDNFIELAFYLEKIFERKIDLLTIEALSAYMKPKILKEAYFESIQ